MTRNEDNAQRFLAAYLAERDEPCPACGYNLRGLTGEACPECGESLRLRVGILEPRLGLFVTGLVGLAGGLGFCGLILVYAVYSLLARVWTIDRTALVSLVAGCLACGSALYAWVRHRGRIRDWATGYRVLAAAGC